MTRGPASRCLPLPAAGASRFVGDPVDVVTGNLIDQETDFRLPSAAVAFAWSRAYDSSRRKADRGVGRGFRHGLDHELRFDLDGMRYVSPTWNEVAFPALNRDGDSALRQTLLLVRLTEHRYRLEEPGGRSYEFGFVSLSAPAQLLYVRERERAIELRYDRARLTGVGLGEPGTLRIDWDGTRIARVTLLAAAAIATEGGKHMQLARYAYDSRGRLTEVENAYKHRLQYRYDDAERITQKIGRRGYAFRFRYDDQGRCVESRGEDGSEAVQLEYRPLERTTIVTRHDGGRWRYLYDTTGVVTHVIDPFDGIQAFALDDEGKVVREIDPLGNVSEIEYDARGVAVAKIDPLGNRLPLPEDIEAAVPLAHREGQNPLEWEYGQLFEPPARLPSRTSSLVRVPADARASVRVFDPEWGGKTRMIRDLQGLPLREEREDGAARRWAFDENANVRWKIDFDGHKREFEYTSDNHFSREIDALGRVTRYEHSPSEQVIAVTDPGGTRTEYVRDEKDRVTEVRRHGRVRERYEYDLAGNLVTKRNTSGEPIVELTVGPGNRRLARTLSSGESQRFEYDERGRLIQAESAAGSCEFAYASSGRRTRDLRDGVGVEHGRTYVIDRTTTVFGRFSIRLRRLDANTWLLIDPLGRSHALRQLEPGVLQRELHNGWSELSQYDLRGRCLFKRLYRHDDRDRLWQRSFQYSGEGDLVGRNDSRRGSTRYLCDASHRLQQVEHPDGKIDEYVYDAADNLLRMPGLREGFVSAKTEGAERYYEAAGSGGVALQSGNRLYRANGESFVYDARDHVVARERTHATTRFVRDSLDRLISIEGPGLSWQAKYDPLGRRTEKTSNGRTTRYYWDTDRLAAEILPDGRVRIYVYVDALAMVPMLCVEYDSCEADPAEGRCYYFVSNHLGSIEAVLDDEGDSVWSARLEPYGSAHVELGQQFHQPLRFPGHFYDDETGLHYNRFRYYDPTLGRYLESDPKGLEGGLNLYAYTRNPLRQVDLRGLNTSCPNGEDCPQRRRQDDEDGADTESAPLPRPGGDPDAPKQNDQPLNSKGLTSEQDAYFRNRIDNAPNEAAATQARYDRNCAARDNAGQPSHLSPADWTAASSGVLDNSARGRAQEAAVLNDLGVSNNNEGSSPKQYPCEDGTQTRPDAVTNDSVIEVKSVPDSRHADGEPRTVYRTDQIEAQQAGASKDEKQHVTVITNGEPDNCRPSGPLADPDNGSQVLHRNSDSGDWSGWNPDANEGNGGWEKLDGTPTL
jgi:RHS repeat-associated protein